MLFNLKLDTLKSAVSSVETIQCRRLNHSPNLVMQHLQRIGVSQLVTWFAAVTAKRIPAASWHVPVHDHSRPHTIWFITYGSETAEAHSQFAGAWHTKCCWMIDTALFFFVWEGIFEILGFSYVPRTPYILGVSVHENFILLVAE